MFPTIHSKCPSFISFLSTRLLGSPTNEKVKLQKDENRKKDERTEELSAIRRGAWGITEIGTCERIPSHGSGSTRHACGPSLTSLFSGRVQKGPRISILMYDRLESLLLRGCLTSVHCFVPEPSLSRANSCKYLRVPWQKEWEMPERHRQFIKEPGKIYKGGLFQIVTRYLSTRVASMKYASPAWRHDKQGIIFLLLRKPPEAKWNVQF